MHDPLTSSFLEEIKMTRIQPAGWWWQLSWWPTGCGFQIICVPVWNRKLLVNKHIWSTKFYCSSKCSQPVFLWETDANTAQQRQHGKHRAFLPLENTSVKMTSSSTTILQIFQQCGIISENFIFPYIRRTNFFPVPEMKPLLWRFLIKRVFLIFFYPTPEEIQHLEPYYIINLKNITTYSHKRKTLSCTSVFGQHRDPRVSVTYRRYQWKDHVLKKLRFQVESGRNRMWHKTA